MIREFILKRMEHYEKRDPRVIYAHHLDNTVWFALNETKRVINGHMIVGELIHLALTNIVNDAPEVCREIEIDSSILDEIEKPVRDRFIHVRGGRTYVIVCGTADGLTENGAPVELKTTRGRIKLKPEWINRIRTYSWLYGKNGILVVFHVITGEEVIKTVDKPSDDEVKEKIIKWLKGEYPVVTLPTSRFSG